MKIYQIHQYGGEWEDRYDYILGSYLHKERAEEALVVVQMDDEIQFQQSRHCADCPVVCDLDTDDVELLSEKCRQHCDRFVLEEYDDGCPECANWQSYYEKPNYRIKEVEVIE